MTAPNKETKLQLSLIGTNMAHWRQASMIPITYGQLLSGTVGAELQATFRLLKDIAGEQLWERFYSGGNVTTEQYVPVQLGIILATSLSKADAAMKKYNKDHDFTDRAKLRFSELQTEDDEAKRQRTGPYSR